MLLFNVLCTVLLFMPDKTVCSCQVPERSALGVGYGARPAQFSGKESVETQQRWERHDEGQRKIHLGRDAGGSADCQFII
jgi:hypothetical protein